MSPEFKKIFSQYAGYAFAKQLAFDDFLGERGWSVDVGQGSVTFGTDLSFPIQLLGTESEGDDTWLWAWANESSNLPPTLLKSCNELKTLGEERSIEEFTERSFSNEPVNGHMLAMVASGINSESCYYRGPYDGGALYFLVHDVPKEFFTPVQAQRAITVISELISQFEVDHKPMIRSFLTSQEFELSEQQDTLIAQRSGNSIEISFDTDMRIDKIEGKSSTHEEPKMKKKSGWKFWR